jgi:hypothetical protein
MSLEIKQAHGKDLQKLAWAIGLKFTPCPKCKSTTGWGKLLFWRIIHKRRCEHERLWREIATRQITVLSLAIHSRQ